jgi:hypothetical protein
MSINVEILGGSLPVQHYIEILQRQAAPPTVKQHMAALPGSY